MLRMILPDLEYLVLNSFQDLKKKDYFKSQEILHGKSICEICLGSTEEVKEELKKFRQVYQIIDRSIIEDVIDDDDIRREHMKRTEFYPKPLIIQFDLNFVGTVERALKFQTYKSLKLIFDTILEVIDTFEYQPYLMYDLPLILEQRQIQIDDFYNLSASERKNQDAGFCNLEIEIKDDTVSLPPFSDKTFEFYTIEKFENFLNIQGELSGKICEVDRLKPKEVEKKYETEYFYIDYQYLIIGSTIRALREGEPIPDFNDLMYAEIIAKKGEDDTRNTFYLQESIQKIIDSQWDRTKRIQKILFIIYVFFYCVPMCVSCFQINSTVDSLMFDIALTPALILLFIEVVQMQKQGVDYFMGWNIIDMSQLVVFGVLFYMRI